MLQKLTDCIRMQQQDGICFINPSIYQSDRNGYDEYHRIFINLIVTEILTICRGNPEILDSIMFYNTAGLGGLFQIEDKDGKFYQIHAYEDLGITRPRVIDFYSFLNN